MLTYDAKAVAHLDRLYSTPQIVDQRRRLRAVISARPGEVGLDLGCGVAYLASEAHGISSTDVAAWEQDLRSRTADGEWFFCLNRFIFTATK